MLTVFTAKYTSEHASGGTLTLLMQASHCFDRVKLYFLFGRTLLTRYKQSRAQSNACARARMALALGKLTTGTPKFRGSGFVGMHD